MATVGRPYPHMLVVCVTLLSGFVQHPCGCGFTLFVSRASHFFKTVAKEFIFISLLTAWPFIMNRTKGIQYCLLSYSLHVACNSTAAKMLLQQLNVDKPKLWVIGSLLSSFWKMVKWCGKEALSYIKLHSQYLSQDKVIVGFGPYMMIITKR